MEERMGLRGRRGTDSVPGGNPVYSFFAYILGTNA